MLTFPSQEEWQAVKGYEGLYEVSNQGRVKSLPRNTTKGKILVAEKNHRGYYRVGLTKNNKQKHFSIHRLVAEVFIPNPQNKPQVNHIDGNKQNNSVENLEWVTHSENMKHATEMGLNPMVENNAVHSKPVEMLSLHGVCIQVFKSIADASRHTGIPQNSICQCCLNHKGYKTAGGFVWKYGKGGDDGGN